MQKEIFPIAALLALACSLPVFADELAMPAPVVAPTISLPTKGSTMADVEKKFGTPTKKRPSVGGDSPRQPPITRWDYSEFSVVFENNKVIDSIVPGAPPKLATKKGLQAAPLAPALPVISAPVTPAAAPEPMAPMAPGEPDMPMELSPDASTEMSPDMPMEMAPDASTEMAPDMPMEMAPDASTEMAPDMPMEMAPDASTEMAPDMPMEMAPDASTEMAPDMPMDSSGMEAEAPAEEAPPASEEPQPLP